MAPEVVKLDDYNETVDWWSYGCIIYEMLTGQSPFRDKNMPKDKSFEYIT